MTCVVGLIIMPTILSSGLRWGQSNLVIVTISPGAESAAPSRDCCTSVGGVVGDIVISSMRRGRSMAQLVVRNLDNSVKEKLRRRAVRRRRSLEAEVRDILCDAVARPESSERHLGTRIATRFLGLGTNLDVTELRGHTA